jgi:hypothetical protein
MAEKQITTSHHQSFYELVLFLISSKNKLKANHNAYNNLINVNIVVFNILKESAYGGKANHNRPTIVIADPPVVFNILKEQIESKSQQCE